MVQQVLEIPLPQSLGSLVAAAVQGDQGKGRPIDPLPHRLLVVQQGGEEVVPGEIPGILSQGGEGQHSPGVLGVFPLRQHPLVLLQRLGEVVQVGFVPVLWDCRAAAGQAQHRPLPAGGTGRGGGDSLGHISGGPFQGAVLPLRDRGGRTGQGERQGGQQSQGC